MKNADCRLCNGLGFLRKLADILVSVQLCLYQRARCLSLLLNSGFPGNYFPSYGKCETTIHLIQTFDCAGVNRGSTHNNPPRALKLFSRPFTEFQGRT